MTAFLGINYGKIRVSFTLLIYIVLFLHNNLVVCPVSSVLLLHCCLCHCICYVAGGDGQDTAYTGQHNNWGWHPRLLPAACKAFILCFIVLC